MKTQTVRSNDIFLHYSDTWLARQYVRAGGVFAVLVFKAWSKVTRKVVFKNLVASDLDRNTPIVIAANHEKRMDPPAIFAGLKFTDLLAYAPVKFLTYHKYYHSRLKPLLYTTGCYPTEGPGPHGVSGSIFYAQNGYRVFIFPEGRRTVQSESDPKNGVSYVLKDVPDARLILVRIHWQDRTRLLSRPKLEVTFSEADKKLNRNDPTAIMDAIYKL